MREHLTLLLLLVSVCFYGQETVELEGFYKINGEEHMFFPLNGKEVNAPILLEIKEGQTPESFTNTALVKVKGNMIKQHFHDESYLYLYKIKVADITVKDNSLLLENYLKEHRFDKLPKLDEEKGRVMYFEEEGYYLGPFEGHIFYIIENNEIVDAALPLFDKKVTDSIKLCLDSKCHSFLQGVYMKISGLRAYGKYQGIYNGKDNHLNVSKIVEIDFFKSYWEFHAEKIKESGGCNDDDKTNYFFCNFLPEGKSFAFKSREGNECWLECIRTGPYLDIVFKENEDTGLTSNIKGRLLIAPCSCFDSASLDYGDPMFHEIIFSSLNYDEYYLYDLEKAVLRVSESLEVTFYAEKDKDGNITAQVANKGNYFYLTEVKN